MTTIVRIGSPALCFVLLLAVFAAGSARAVDAYSDAKLESFVAAAIQVQSLMREYQPQIQAAEPPQRADNLRRQAKAKMEAAINETPGITIGEYSRIVVDTQYDPSLNDRVDRMFRATTGQ